MGCWRGRVTGVRMGYLCRPVGASFRLSSRLRTSSTFWARLTPARTSFAYRLIQYSLGSVPAPVVIAAPVAAATRQAGRVADVCQPAEPTAAMAPAAVKPLVSRAGARRGRGVGAPAVGCGSSLVTFAGQWSAGACRFMVSSSGGGPYGGLGHGTGDSPPGLCGFLPRGRAARRGEGGMA